MRYSDKLAQLPESPVMTTLTLISSKWKVLILTSLLNGKKRFGELRRMLGISQKVLTQQLRELESAGLVVRTTYPEVPPRVEYELTELGMTLKPIGKALWDWGLYYKSTLEQDASSAGDDSPEKGTE